MQALFLQITWHIGRCIIILNELHKNNLRKVLIRIVE
jgi:hypothetical protein